jgi:hypothetical protein
MKAKTIVGLMACAVLVPAFADTTPIDNNKPTTNDWFSTSVPGSTIYASGAAWATGVSVTPPTVDATAHVLVIDADTTKPATLTPTVVDADKKGSLGVVTIASKAYLAPSAIADLPQATALGAAQVGFAVATETVSETTTTNFYAYTKTSTSGVWTKLKGANPPSTETDTEFTIVLNYNTSKVAFMVGSTTLSVAVASDAGAVDATELSFTPAEAMISDVAAIGSGTITSIDAKFEKAVAVKGNTKYATIAEAYNSTETGDVVTWNSSTGEAETGDAAYAPNGLTKAVCMALNMPTDDATAKIALRPANKKVANKITLATAVNPVDNVTVAFAVTTKSGTAAGSTSYPADAIELPLGTGTYTVTPTVSGK